MAVVSLVLHDPVRGLSFTVREDWPAERAFFEFTEGNGSCDCNRSQRIREQCDGSFTEMECGDVLELKALLVDGVAQALVGEP